jgi:hypothetical protein
MKNRMASMTHPAFGLSFETAVAPVGGTPAPAAAVAPAAPAPAAAPALAAPAPVAAGAAPEPTRTGFFKDLKRAAIAPLDAPSPADKVQVLSDDKKTVLFEGSQSEAEAFVAKAAPPVVAAPVVAAVPPAPVAAVLAKPFMGRADITTQEQAEDLYRKSGAEAQRLAAQTKADAARITDFEARLAAKDKELELARQTPAKPELTKEELNALWKENPAEAAEYMQARKDRTQTQQAAVERAAQAVRERAENAQKLTAQAVENWDAMLKDPKTYPKFAELEPRIDAIYKASVRNGKSPYDLNPDAPKTLYVLAMGQIYIELQGKGIETQAAAAETARLKAESDAAAARAAGGSAAAPATPDNRTAQQKSDDAWRENREKARGENPGTRIFRGRTTT